MRKTAVVILAAGAGSRMGVSTQIVPKCLVPIGQKAVLSVIIDDYIERYQADDLSFIVVANHQHELVTEYVKTFHYDDNVKVVIDDTMLGPGHAAVIGMWSAQDAIDMFIITACDTIATYEQTAHESFIIYDDMPLGTLPERWCRLSIVDDCLVDVYDKTADSPGITNVSIAVMGLSSNDADNVTKRFDIMNDSDTGYIELSDLWTIGARCVKATAWHDIGDQEAYTNYVRNTPKPSGVTYVYNGNVMKIFTDASDASKFSLRCNSSDLMILSPYTTVTTANVVTYRQVPGHVLTGADAARFVSWHNEAFLHTTNCDEELLRASCEDMYFYKTRMRINSIESSRLRAYARAVYNDIPQLVMMQLISRCVPKRAWHGDMIYDNIIVSDTPTIVGEFTFIDIRPKFGNTVMFGDARYDVAKFLTSSHVNWGIVNGHVAYGTVWAEQHGNPGEQLAYYTPECEYLGVMCLLSSAPLHPGHTEAIIEIADEWVRSL